MYQILKIAIAIAWLTLPAAAHEWYPRECCGGNECREVEVSETPDGYRFRHPFVNDTMVLVPYSQHHRLSQDGKFHACYWGPGHSKFGTMVHPDGKPPCFIIPDRGT